jgi:hypothetical protein
LGALAGIFLDRIVAQAAENVVDFLLAEYTIAHVNLLIGRN